MTCTPDVVGLIIDDIEFSSDVCGVLSEMPCTLFVKLCVLDVNDWDRCGEDGTWFSGLLICVNAVHWRWLSPAMYIILLEGKYAVYSNQIMVYVSKFLCCNIYFSDIVSKTKGE